MELVVGSQTGIQSQAVWPWPLDAASHKQSSQPPEALYPEENVPSVAGQANCFDVLAVPFTVTSGRTTSSVRDPCILTQIYLGGDLLKRDNGGCDFLPHMLKSITGRGGGWEGSYKKLFADVKSL